MVKVLIQNGLVLDPSQNKAQKENVYIKNGKISKSFHKPDLVIDAKGLWVTPGLVDLHVHFRDPGLTYKEDIFTGLSSAVAGGYTTVCPMANTVPVCDNADIVAYQFKKAKEANLAHLFPIASLTKGMKGEQLTDFSALKQAGVKALSEDGKSVASESVFFDACKKAKEADLPIFDHCESPFLLFGGSMVEGKQAKHLGQDGITNESEDIMVLRDAAIARRAGAKLHICHVSTAGSLDILRKQKKLNRKLTAEVCPHHFVLCDKDINAPNANFKMAPPLRSRRDRTAILEGLKDGTIDVIATDHAPHAHYEKEQGSASAGISGMENFSFVMDCVGFGKAPNGVIGLETALPLGITYLVRKKILTPLELIDKMSTKPARILGIKAGTLKSGAPADIAIIDPNQKWIIDKTKFRSKSTNTPFDGMKVTGKVKMTLVNGKVVYENKT